MSTDGRMLKKGAGQALQGVHFILYVRDQDLSTAFYAGVLQLSPTLEVPGMTEFELPGGAILGLMPESGIRKLLGKVLPNPSLARGTPRAELYLMVEDAVEFYFRALAAGAHELSTVQNRDWGHAAGYVLDPDGHVIAFAHEIDAA